MAVRAVEVAYQLLPTHDPDGDEDEKEPQPIDDPTIRDLSLFKESCDQFSARLTELQERCDSELEKIAACPEPTLIQSLFSGSLKKHKFQHKVEERLACTKELVRAYPALCQDYQALIPLRHPSLTKERLCFRRLDKLLAFHKIENLPFVKREYIPLQKAFKNGTKSLLTIQSQAHRLFSTMARIFREIHWLCQKTLTPEQQSKPLPPEQVTYQIAKPFSEDTLSSQKFPHLQRALQEWPVEIPLAPLQRHTITVPDTLEEGLELRFKELSEKLLDLIRESSKEWIFNPSPKARGPFDRVIMRQDASVFIVIDPSVDDWMD